MRDICGPNHSKMGSSENLEVTNVPAIDFSPYPDGILQVSPLLPCIETSSLSLNPG